MSGLPQPSGSSFSAAQSDASRLLETIVGQKQQTAQSSAAAQQSSAQQEDADRTHITRTVMDVFRWAFLLSVPLLIVLSLIMTSAAGEAIKALVDILKSVLLPIVTLVLGYYFGRGGKV